jgi:hypothetical protein
MTVILDEADDTHRQIYTDGRGLPKEFAQPAWNQKTGSAQAPKPVSTQVVTIAAPVVDPIAPLQPRLQQARVPKNTVKPGQTR